MILQLTFLPPHRVAFPACPLSCRVVANKVDLEDRAKVHTTEGAEFARNNSLEFCQVSAYREINVESPFAAAAKLYTQVYQNKLETLNGI
mmetsp:Transcript_11332/g.25765  ORF Transcript_11332/g.25765 Transcript_11332/m.25765 type:complete len:90 (-) Transcript_11332:320-589(-)